MRRACVLALLLGCQTSPTCDGASFERETARLRAWPGDAPRMLEVGLSVGPGCAAEVISEAPWLEVERTGDALTLSRGSGADASGLYRAELTLVEAATGVPLDTLDVTLSVMREAPVEGEPHVLVIGIDGCRPDALLAAEAPDLDALGALGRVSFDASTQLEAPTKSGPGWASVLTGVDADKHLVESNEDLADVALDAHPSFLARAEEAGRSVAVSAQWNGIRSLIEPSLAERSGRGDAEAVTSAAATMLGGDNDLVFVHLDDVDIQGHLTGFSAENPRYLAAIERVDARVGSLIDALVARPTFERERWLVIVTTDHGGSGREHGALDAENRTIFLVLSDTAGPRGVLEGASWSHLDVAPTALNFLGVAVEPSWGLDGTAR
jgi:hypothetical protein